MVGDVSDTPLVIIDDESTQSTSSTFVLVQRDSFLNCTLLSICVDCTTGLLSAPRALAVINAMDSPSGQYNVLSVAVTYKHTLSLVLTETRS